MTFRTALFTVPNNMEAISGRGSKFITPTEPFGPMYLAAYLESMGKQVRLVDTFALGHGLREILEITTEYQPRLIGFSSLTSQAHLLCRLLLEIRKAFPGLWVVLGNIHASIYAEYFLEKGYADFIVHGEGEETLNELIDILDRAGDLGSVQGISWLRNGRVVHNGQRQPIRDLDTIPMPARHMVPMERYRLPFYWGPFASSSRYYKALFTSRGCPYRCHFCSVHHNRKVRTFSVSRVMEELNILVTHYGAKYIQFLDSLFMLGKRRVMDICDAIVSRGFDFQWSCEGRVNAASKDVLEAMKKAGCVQIAYGIESGVQELLDNVDKRCTIEQIEQAVRYTVEAGIKPIGLFILGLPGETAELSRKTIEFAKKLPLDYAQFAICTPFPGSQIYYDLLKEGKIDPYDWERFSQYISFTDRQPIWSTDGMTGHELVALQRKAIREFYLRPRVIANQACKLRLHNLGDFINGARAMLVALKGA